MSFKTKVVEFFGKKRTIFLQNDNGPCPLLAICNYLSLEGLLNYKRTVTEVSQERLLAQVAERIIVWNNSSSDNESAGYKENQERNIADAMDLLPKLTTGIDVNVKFRRIGDFEFTPACAIFDLLGIPLYHGWILDPWDRETANAIGSKSYNALTEEFVSLQTRDNVDENSTSSTTGASVLIRNFMERNASQLTSYGLICLREDMEEQELCVFFRNNHFNTMFKYKDELYILATDQGYEDQPDLVWEKLNGVNGDTSFINGKFQDFKYVVPVDDDSDASSDGDEPDVGVSSSSTNAGFNGSRKIVLDPDSNLQDQQGQQSSVRPLQITLPGVRGKKHQTGRNGRGG